MFELEELLEINLRKWYLIPFQWLQSFISVIFHFKLKKNTIVQKQETCKLSCGLMTHTHGFHKRVQFIPLQILVYANVNKSLRIIYRNCISATHDYVSYKSLETNILYSPVLLKLHPLFQCCHFIGGTLYNMAKLSFIGRMKSDRIERFWIF